MKQDLAIRALNMAVALRRPPPGSIHPTDRPSHGLQENRCRAKEYNGFCNPRRKHSTPGWKSPVAFERKAA